MNDTKNGQPDDAELSPPEALLPWYATGRLSAEEQAQVESALAADGELRRRLALVCDEEADTIAVNESLGLPSGAAMDRLMARIEAYETEHPRHASVGERALSWVSGVLSGLSPRVLAMSAMAAAVVICLQAGLLTGLVVDRHAGAHYTTASLEEKTESNGTYALISFAGSVSMQDATAFLEAHHASLVEGPKPGGIYRIKIADEKLSGDALNARLAAFRAETKVVGFILPEAAAR
jgi:hypothetical protein